MNPRRAAGSVLALSREDPDPTKLAPNESVIESSDKESPTVGTRGRPAGKPQSGPLFTVVVNFFNMRREAARTLHNLSPEYQRGMTASEYEVVAIDNGSTEPLDPKHVESFGPNFSHVFEPTDSPSPAAALNRALRATRAPWVICLLDGARMLSPGVLEGVRAARRLTPESFAYTLNMHLGPEPQTALASRGYGPADEDTLLDRVPWKENGYRLFGVSSFAPSARYGFFSPVAESSCFALRRRTLLEIGGFDERFRSPGGGLVNHDVFERLVSRPGTTAICLLGEATFHQFHGGVSTNVPEEERPWNAFKREYKEIHGRPYRLPEFEPIYLGRMRPEVSAVQATSAGFARERAAAAD